MAAVANEREQGVDAGPVENLLHQSTTLTQRAINAIRSAESAKADLRNDLTSLTTSFDKAIQKSLALIDRLDESVYSGRIDNAKKRAKVEKEAKNLIEKAHSNPSDNADLGLYERTMDVLRDSAIGLHREYFNYEETVDARDILAQLCNKLPMFRSSFNKHRFFHVLEYTYRTNALERSLAEKQAALDAGGMDTLSNILNKISESLDKLKTSNSDLDAPAADIEKTLNEMKEKLAKGIYGPDNPSKPPYETAIANHPRIVAATTSGYTL
ncbi:unnamed protein product [Cylicocyclus nassatus]|uniref:Uncharacterized protein n=1 Tax=Cylicocyclus nassatus TaxID=53992 RepID=A0AA36GI06_CYLNA|nr:unnamed protein product [Cylicocyclus nassatus]